MCICCVLGVAHPMFLVVTTDSRYNPLDELHPQPSVAYVGRTRCPEEFLKSLNKVKGYPTPPKASKAGAPYHRYEIIVGPMYGKGASKKAKQIVQNKARKTTTRLIEARRFAIEHKLQCFVRDKAVFEKLKK